MDCLINPLEKQGRTIGPKFFNPIHSEQEVQRQTPRRNIYNCTLWLSVKGQVLSWAFPTFHYSWAETQKCFSWITTGWSRSPFTPDLSCFPHFSLLNPRRQVVVHLAPASVWRFFLLKGVVSLCCRQAFASCGNSWVSLSNNVRSGPLKCLEVMYVVKKRTQRSKRSNSTLLCANCFRSETFFIIIFFLWFGSSQIKLKFNWT